MKEHQLSDIIVPLRFLLTGLVEEFMKVRFTLICIGWIILVHMNGVAEDRV